MTKRLLSIRMWLMLLATVLVFGGVLAMQWYGSVKMHEAMDNMPAQTVTITAGEATTAPWQSSVQAVGTLAAIRGAELATEVPGTVVDIFFDNGAAVAANDAILALNSATDRAELAELQAAMELAELELRRAHNLVAQRNISEAELDRRASELEQVRARVNAQRARIEQKTLRAPYSGRLGIRRFNMGDYVQAGETIIELQALDRLYANFKLPEQYSRQVSTGMPVRARVRALGGEAFEGTVTAIAPVVDPNTRNFTVQATLDNREDVLRPGMTANLSLPLGERTEQVIVPRTAISYRPYGNSVYLIKEAEQGLTVSQRFVTLGAVRGDMVAIEEGLAPGERIATSGILKLDSGVPVVVDNSIEPDASLSHAPDND